MKKKKYHIPEITYDQWLILLEAMCTSCPHVSFPDDIDYSALNKLIQASEVLVRHRKNRPAYVFIGGKLHCLIQIRRKS